MRRRRAERGRSSDFAPFSTSSTEDRVGHRARPTRAARTAAVARSSRGLELKTLSTASGGRSPSGADSSAGEFSAVAIAGVEIEGIQAMNKFGMAATPGKFAGVQALCRFGSATGDVCASPGLKGKLLCAPLACGGTTGGGDSLLTEISNAWNLPCTLSTLAGVSSRASIAAMEMASRVE